MQLQSITLGLCVLRSDPTVDSNELIMKSMNIGKNSCTLDENNREGSKCLIMNCDQLKDIHIDNDSFHWYESLELKNLPSLISIYLNSGTFCLCHSIVFDSMNE